MSVRIRMEEWADTSDHDLATGALAGSESAWNEIVRRHTRRVVVALLARGIPLDAAEDLAQETWLRLIRQQRAGRLEALRLPGLPLAQAHWLALEALRSEKRRLALSEEMPLPNEMDSTANPETWTLQRERLHAIREELSRCPPRSQQVFRAVYGPELRRHAEVAGEMGLSLQRVRQILCEVRARLRRTLQALEGEESS